VLSVVKLRHGWQRFRIWSAHRSPETSFVRYFKEVSDLERLIGRISFGSATPET